ncbi:HU family DNA-binding protein [Cellulomonas fengjieae]|uniref:HU family DNA-binding protein n=1 Tax=Cellulomonas fengjieae TaxID=2819978 RepID=UPI001AAE478E|nr:HU family DNA-binding protein [Cellulomonas fengjieae]MBO3101345.1 HU family DNA-binding protein [Cellulomonas fengjieae]
MVGKAQIADRIAARGATRPAAAAAVDAVLDEITAALASGERVTFTGFGTFEAAGRGARTARNPRTGEPLEVPATTVARFRPGATLRARVAGGPGTAGTGTHGAVADLSSVQGLGGPAQAGASAEAAPTADVAPEAPATKADGKTGTKTGARSDATKARGKKADTKKADAKKADAKKADAKKADAKKADAKKADAKKHGKKQAKKNQKDGKGRGKKS